MTSKHAVRLITLGTLYPSCLRPRRGLFVEARLRELRRREGISCDVIAPVPWYPFTSSRIGTAALHAAQPAVETRDGVVVTHPRFVSLPRELGEAVGPLAMALGCRAAVAHLKNAGGVELVLDAQYFFPDGAAAALLSRWLDLPLTITARGSDINHFSTLKVPRRWILWAATQAQAVICVSGALRDRLAELGVPDRKLHVVRNGVDLDFFSPDLEKSVSSRGRPLVVSVGNLVELKGHDLVIDAVASLNGVDLAIIGDGPLREALEAKISNRGLADRITLTGSLDREQVRERMRRADTLVLASSREGFANVLIESLACGTPVVATRVGGNPEIVTAPEAGVLVERSSEGIAEGIRQILAAGINRDDTRRFAERFGWGPSCQALACVYQLASGSR